MGALAVRLAQRARYVTTNPKNPAYWAERIFGGGSMTATGISVGPNEANRVAAILGGSRIVSEDIGGCPLPIMRPDPRRPKASVEERDHWAWDLLNWKPNPEMTALDFRGALTGHAMLRGIGYAEMVFDAGMRVIGMWPLRPDRTRQIRAGVDAKVAGVPDGDLCYVVTLKGGEQRVLRKEVVFTLPGFGSDGIRGYNVVDLMRETIALSLAAEEHGARFYANDARPGFVLTHPGNPSEVAQKNLRDSFESRHQGLTNAHRMAILEEGIDIKAVGMTMTDAQYVETMKLGIVHFAQALRIPLSKLGYPDSRSYANVEEEDTAYQKGVAPWANRWEQRLRLHGVTPAPSYAHHTLQALVRGDMKARAEYFHAMKLDGNITANHVLALEDMPLSDSPAADELLIPVNMIPASTFDERGLTYAQRVGLSNEMVLRGFDPDAARAAFGLSPVKHTGLVPTAVQLDPETSAKLAASLQGGISA